MGYLEALHKKRRQVMSGDLITHGGQVSALGPDHIKAQVGLVQRVMRAVMKQGTHYGTIPGTNKPTLFKAGAEVLLTTFRIAVDPQVEDLGSADEVRFRVRAVGIHQGSGVVVGTGLGECSSNEEKFRWRNAVCEAEFNETAEDRRRIKYQRDGGAVYQRQQIRTVPADVANTVLKMAKKRAQIDMCLTATAASDIFTQDLEDGEDSSPAPHAAPDQVRAPRASGGTGNATEKQVKLLGARLKAHGKTEAALLDAFTVASLEQIPFDKVNEALAWLAAGGD